MLGNKNNNFKENYRFPILAGYIFFGFLSIFLIGIPLLILFSRWVDKKDKASIMSPQTPKQQQQQQPPTQTPVTTRPLMMTPVPFPLQQPPQMPLPIPQALEDKKPEGSIVIKYLNPQEDIIEIKRPQFLGKPIVLSNSKILETAVVKVNTQTQGDDDFAVKVLSVFDKAKTPNQGDVCIYTGILGFDTRSEPDTGIFGVNAARFADEQNLRAAQKRREVAITEARQQNDFVCDIIKDVINNAQKNNQTKIALLLQSSANTGGSAGHIQPVFIEFKNGTWEITTYDSKKGLQENKSRHNFIASQFQKLLKNNTKFNVKQLDYEQQTNNGCLVSSLLQLQACIFGQDSVQKMLNITSNSEFKRQHQVHAQALYTLLAYSHNEQQDKQKFKDSCQAEIISESLSP